MPFIKYGALWADGLDALQIEQACIVRNGRWTNTKGVECGLGLFHHYKAAQKLMWPEDDHHRWSDLMLSEILQNKHTAIIGPKDAAKTYTMARYGLTDYLMFPDETLILMSSTDVRGLELRVWGAVKDLWRRAKDRYDWLAGAPIDSKHALCTDSLAEDMDIVRDMRKGILCVPCRSTSGAWLGLNNFVGLKQKRRRLLSDEVQFMAQAFMEAPASLDGINFKAVYVGHPLGQGDPLDKLAEPKNGWGTEGEITKTTVWDNKFLGGRTINLVGTDSPNFDTPSPNLGYLIDQKMIDGVVSFYTKDSSQYWSKCMGVRRTGMFAHRVITIKLCEQFRAFDKVIWKGTATTKVYAFDPAFGGIGGDRCVGGAAEFGTDIDGKLILLIHPPVIIPVSVRYDMPAEDQIATYVMNDCVRMNIPPENVFFDSTARGGGIVAAFARIWSPAVNPVEFGGKSTERPVTLDHFIKDPHTGQRRLKKCSEEYSKFVTELWFSVRYAIESGQVRELSREVAEEGCQREWIEVSGGRTELETKSDMKERTGRSPDLFDQLAIIVEGARRKGFSISKLANAEAEEADHAWLEELARKAQERRTAHSLVYS